MGLLRKEARFDCLFKFRNRKFSVGNLYISENREKHYQWQFIHKINVTASCFHILKCNYYLYA